MKTTKPDSTVEQLYLVLIPIMKTEAKSAGGKFQQSPKIAANLVRESIIKLNTQSNCRTIVAVNSLTTIGIERIEENNEKKIIFVQKRFQSPNYFDVYS